MMAFFMPLSIFMTNASMIMIAVNWVLECRYKEKLQRIRDNWSILVFCLIYIVHLVWLANTSNFAYAANDLRVKLPLLVLPIVIGTSDLLSAKRLNQILLVFVGGVFVSSCIGLSARLLGFGDNFRDLAMFVSNIRLSLMACLSIFVMLYFVYKGIFFRHWTIVIAVLVILQMLVFMSLIQSITGYVCLFATLIAVLVSVSIKEKRKLYSRLCLLLAIVVPLAVVGMLAFCVYNFYQPTGDNVQLEKTVNGIPYDEVSTDGIIENGNVVGMNISRQELEQAWPQRSNIPLDSLDHRGQPIYYTLLRYMTSLGLTKDAEGLAKLSSTDIKNIESGETNYKYVKNGGLLNRIYVIIWEFDIYIKTGDCNGHSVTQRIEFLKYGMKLIGRNFFAGTGVGDVNDEYQAIYEEENFSLLRNYWHRAHNQFVTFFIAFGVFGFLLCVFAWFYPAFAGWKMRNYYFLIFFLIATISMFSDDTLETSTGAVFVAFLYSLLRWTTDEKQEINDGQ
ncbi:MAG: O-antigen ligase family protein [Bacteroidales bacterium]|nr:O-antigen ligase family protein [Bacteroidales bacterium]